MKIPKIIPGILLMLLGLSGCTILENLDEITTLSQYSREKDAQHRLVKSIDDDYAALVRVIDQGKINTFKDEQSFQKAFGDPIVRKPLSNGQERWLYRNAIYRLSKDKVYLYFDHAGLLVKWEKLPCSKFF